MEHDRDELFSRLDASPGLPPPCVHQSMTPAELRVLVPRIASQNPATVNHLAELAATLGRACALGPDMLAEILWAAALLPERHIGRTFRRVMDRIRARGANINDNPREARRKR
jgi:hypothetical protein